MSAASTSPSPLQNIVFIQRILNFALRRNKPIYINGAGVRVKDMLLLAVHPLCFVSCAFREAILGGYCFHALSNVLLSINTSRGIMFRMFMDALDRAIDAERIFEGTWFACRTVSDAARASLWPPNFSQKSTAELAFNWLSWFLEFLFLPFWSSKLGKDKWMLVTKSQQTHQGKSALDFVTKSSTVIRPTVPSVSLYKMLVRVAGLKVVGEELVSSTSSSLSSNLVNNRNNHGGARYQLANANVFQTLLHHSWIFAQRCDTDFDGMKFPPKAVEARDLYFGALRGVSNVKRFKHLIAFIFNVFRVHWSGNIGYIFGDENEEINNCDQQQEDLRNYMLNILQCDDEDAEKNIMSSSNRKRNKTLHGLRKEKKMIEETLIQFYRNDTPFQILLVEYEKLFGKEESAQLIKRKKREEEDRLRKQNEENTNGNVAVGEVDT